MLLQRDQRPVRLGAKTWTPADDRLVGHRRRPRRDHLEMSPAPMRFTDNPLDLAIDGPGFFAVLTETGEVAYTRDGRLRVDAEGYLATLDGLLVLGERAPSTWAREGPSLTRRGKSGSRARWRAKSPSGSFLIARALSRLGSNLLAPTEGSGEAVLAANTRVQPGYLEGANVNVVREMVDLIATQRAYEANQKMIQVQDETLGRLINDAATMA